jgi:hypothetical protein
VHDRRPPARMESRAVESAPAQESRDERLTVRMTPTERASWQEAARRFGEEESRYFRRCADIGRRVMDSGALVSRTVA